MHRFSFKKDELYCEEIPVRKIAESVGSPFYLYSLGTFLDHYHKIQKAFEPVGPLICYSMKANSNLAICKRLVMEGAGLDVVSGGELYKARLAGVKSSRIVFASVGKSDAEIEQAIRAGILMFNVESEPELYRINKVAARLRKVQAVALRMNPHVEADTHHYISTGVHESKFGMDEEVVFRLFHQAYRFPFLNLTGLHIHIGSQITESAPFVQAVKKGLQFIRKLELSEHEVKTLNIGGGLGIIYSEEKPQTAQQFADVILPLLKGFRLKLILEPGRFISGNSGILVTRLLYWKKTKQKVFAIVDAGMNDLIRPSLYHAYHEIVPVIKKKGSKNYRVDVVGPICESGDFLGKDRMLPRLEPGDLLAVMSAGAYGFTMSSQYNSRPRIPEVIGHGKKFYIARRRETYQDLVKHERIPKEILR